VRRKVSPSPPGSSCRVPRAGRRQTLQSASVPAAVADKRSASGRRAQRHRQRLTDPPDNSALYSEARDVAGGPPVSEDVAEIRAGGRTGFQSRSRPRCCTAPRWALSHNTLVTHHETLGVDLYLRIAPSSISSLLGGRPGTGPSRSTGTSANEGVSTREQPRFPCSRPHQAYGDIQPNMADLVENLNPLLAQSAPAASSCRGTTATSTSGRSSAARLGRPRAGGGSGTRRGDLAAEPPESPRRGLLPEWPWGKLPSPRSTRRRSSHTLVRRRSCWIPP